MTLDEFRARYGPAGFGVAVYAYDPSGPVTVEIHAPDGSIFQASAATAAGAFATLYPEPEIIHEHRDPDPAPPDSVFD